MYKGKMSNSDKVSVLRNAAIESFVKRKIKNRDLESILEVEVCFRLVETGEDVQFVKNKDEVTTIVKFKVNEELSIIEHMIKGLDFQKLAGKNGYEVTYV